MDKQLRELIEKWDRMNEVGEEAGVGAPSDTIALMIKPTKHEENGKPVYSIVMTNATGKGEDKGIGVIKAGSSGAWDVIMGNATWGQVAQIADAWPMIRQAIYLNAIGVK